jgi:hypothetical protein
LGGSSCAATTAARAKIKAIPKNPVTKNRVFITLISFLHVSELRLVFRSKKTNLMAGFAIGFPKIFPWLLCYCGEGQATRLDLWFIASTDETI